jgi:hypothetical protein
LSYDRGGAGTWSDGPSPRAASQCASNRIKIGSQFSMRSKQILVPSERMARTLSNFLKASHDPVAVGTAGCSVSFSYQYMTCIHGVSTVRGCIPQQLGRGRPPAAAAVLPHAATSHMRMLPQSSGSTRAGAIRNRWEAHGQLRK